MGDLKFTTGRLERVADGEDVEGHDYFDVQSGLTEGGVYIVMRHPGVSVRLDFDPETATPALVELATRLFPQAVDVVLMEMSAYADEREGQKDG